MFPRSRKGSFPPLDCLSNLPQEIMANILGRLPIRDAIQTCVLSRRWRYKWCSITRLEFGYECVQLLADDCASYDDAFANFVNRVLLYHHGPVHEFTIATEAEPNISDLNQWVYYASCNKVRELSLEFVDEVMAPSSLFQCSKLMSLYLSFCKIRKLPVCFEGFMFLKTLRFNYVNIPTSSLEKLISCCPILEILKFSESDLKVFRVHAPLLKCFHIEGVGDGFILQKTPLLRELSVTIRYRNNVHNGNRFVVKFLDHVPSLQKLIGRDYFMKYWSQAEDPATCAITLGHLQFIDLGLNFKNPTEVLHLLKFMEYCPVLEDIRIRACNEGNQADGALGPEFWCRAGDAGCKMLQLKKARLTCYGSTNETEFMKFLLLNAPALKEMHVNLLYSRENMNKKVVAELLRCRRASREAEVVCSGF